MDHASPQRGDLLERSLHLGNGEIRQGGRVARARATFVNANRGSAALRLPSTAFGLAALGELGAE